MHFTPQVCSAQLKEVILAKLAWKRWSCIILFLPLPLALKTDGQCRGGGRRLPR